MDDRRCHPPPPSPIALCGTELCPLSNQPEMMKPHFCSNYRQNGQNPKQNKVDEINEILLSPSHSTYHRVGKSRKMSHLKFFF